MRAARAQAPGRARDANRPRLVRQPTVYDRRSVFTRLETTAATDSRVEYFSHLKARLLSERLFVSPETTLALGAKPALRVRSGSCGGLDLILPDGTWADGYGLARALAGLGVWSQRRGRSSARRRIGSRPISATRSGWCAC